MSGTTGLGRAFCLSIDGISRVITTITRGIMESGATEVPPKDLAIKGELVIGKMSNRKAQIPRLKICIREEFMRIGFYPVGLYR